MFKILIDTCVWLDLAKDVKQEALLTVIEDLYQLGQLRLLVPDIVIAEFARNKDKVVVDSRRSLASALKRASEAVALFGEDGQMNIALDQLHEVAQKLPQLGEAAVNSVARIEKLLILGEQIPTSNAIKIRAAQRAIDRKAPFHRNKNSINDAILAEMYRDVLQTRVQGRIRYAFVTHNIHDFSSPDGSHQLPHPDLAESFSQVKSLYFINLAEAIRRVNPSMVTELMVSAEDRYEARPLSEIVDVIGELLDKIWYNRHLVLQEKIEQGKVKIVDKETFPVKDHSKRPVQRDIWEGAQLTAKKMEAKYGRETLGPYSTFDWGMINGKLSALRWALGEDWDMLDT